jgi:putative aminopeptidase FrvX
VLDDHRDLLQELLTTYGPCGQEDAVRDVCRRELEPHVDELSTDAAGNLIGRIRGSGGDGAGPVLRVVAHLDELSMIIKRVEADGTLVVSPLGTMYPANFGLGPVAVLGDQRTCNGILTLGSEHTTAESMRIWQTKPDQGDQAMDWSHVYVFTGRTPDELAEAGVHIGTRVCIADSKRTLVAVGDYVGCYFMDDRAALVIALAAARALVAERPPADVYIILSTSEEMGGIGAAYASRTVPGDVTVALDVAPTEAEYQTTVSADPVIAYGDSAALYDKAIADRLVDLGQQLGMRPQRGVFGSYESDASNATMRGQTPRAALLGLATLSTHGYEAIHAGLLDNCIELLTAFLRRPEV